MRSYDLVARYGGKEYVCLLPETPLAIRSTGRFRHADRSLYMAKDAGRAQVRAAATVEDNFR